MVISVLSQRPGWCFLGRAGLASPPSTAHPDSPSKSIRREGKEAAASHSSLIGLSITCFGCHLISRSSRARAGKPPLSSGAREREGGRGREEREREGERGEGGEEGKGEERRGERRREGGEGQEEILMMSLAAQ